MNSNLVSTDDMQCSILGKNKLKEKVAMIGKYEFVCRDKNGKEKWVEKGDNLIVNSGLDHSLESILGGGTQITSWFLGLKNSGTPAPGDTMASHASWTENVAYSNATRIPCNFGVTSGQSIDNSASTAFFNINGTATILGGFLVSDSTKGGALGTLFSVRDFPQPRVVSNGDTLEVTFISTQASV